MQRFDDLVERFQFEVEHARCEYEQRRDNPRYDPQVVEYHHGILWAMVFSLYILREASFDDK